eukprot:gene23236-28222_t
MASFGVVGLNFGNVIGQDGKPVDVSQLEGKMLGLYFSAHWCGPCRNFTPKLAAKYRQLQEDGANFEIVFLSADEDEEAATKYFAEMPWKMLSYDDRAGMQSMMEKYQVEGYPTVVLLDEQGEVVSLDANETIVLEPFADWKAVVAQRKADEEEMVRQVAALKATFNLSTFLSTLSDPLLFNNNNNTEEEASVRPLAGKVVGLYFSAHWCPPCRGFTPKLAEKYQALKAQGKDFEVIFVSSDRNDAEFTQYFQEMPWMALKYSDRETKGMLSRVFDVNGIPTLLLFNADGSLMTAQGREVVMSLDFDDWPNFEAIKREKKAEEERIVATMPDEAKIAAHEHALKKMSHVYRGHYGCDVCDTGGEGWVYHCDECGFDAHPLCVFAKA